MRTMAYAVETQRIARVKDYGFADRGLHLLSYRVTFCDPVEFRSSSQVSSWDLFYPSCITFFNGSIFLKSSTILFCTVPRAPSVSAI